MNNTYSYHSIAGAAAHYGKKIQKMNAATRRFYGKEMHLR